MAWYNVCKFVSNRVRVYLEIKLNESIGKLKELWKALRDNATFKVRKFESLFYKINACLQKTTTCIGLQEEQIFWVNI